MRTRITRSLSVAAAWIVLGAALPATAHAGPTERRFHWDELRSGDCRMYDATWKVNSSGVATFDANLISSTGDDAWLMHAELFDRNDSYLVNLVVKNRPPDPGDRGKFVMGLPFANRSTRWIAEGKFDRKWFPLVDGMKLRSHC
ncbi:MAG: hypothetical protein HOQ24_05055 [Mycobacteriaceae bacterium]|nr:hypothetical protein [Mycobacteriaceae bacterium]